MAIRALDGANKLKPQSFKTLEDCIVRIKERITHDFLLLSFLPGKVPRTKVKVEIKTIPREAHANI